MGDHPIQHDDHTQVLTDLRLEWDFVAVIRQPEGAQRFSLASKEARSHFFPARSSP